MGQFQFDWDKGHEADVGSRTDIKIRCVEVRTRARVCVCVCRCMLRRRCFSTRIGDNTGRHKKGLFRHLWTSYHADPALSKSCGPFVHKKCVCVALRVASPYACGHMCSMDSWRMTSEFSDDFVRVGVCRNGNDKQAPSTGMFAIAAAVMLCKSVCACVCREPSPHWRRVCAIVGRCVLHQSVELWHE